MVESEFADSLAQAAPIKATVVPGAFARDGLAMFEVGGSTLSHSKIVTSTKLNGYNVGKRFGKAFCKTTE